MNSSHHMPKFYQAGKFTGENQSASRWLSRIKLDFASSNYDSIPNYMYLWAIYALLDEPASIWCDSVPSIRHILENFDKANSADVKWLERELIKQFPGGIIDNPVERITTRNRSYSLDMSVESDAAATRLGKLYIGRRTKSLNQRPETSQATDGHQYLQDRYHTDQNYQFKTAGNKIEGIKIDEYQFYNRPRASESSQKYYHDQCHGSTTVTETLPVFNKHNSDRAQIPKIPRGILKNSTSYHPKPSVHSFKSPEHTNDSYSRVKSSPPFQRNHPTEPRRESQIPQPQISPNPHCTNSTSGPSELRPIYTSLRGTCREVRTVPSKPQRRYWSYIPLPTTQLTRCPIQKSNIYKDNPLPYYKRTEPNYGGYKTSNPAIASLEERLWASNLSPRTPIKQERTTYSKTSTEW